MLGFNTYTNQDPGIDAFGFEVSLNVAVTSFQIMGRCAFIHSTRHQAGCNIITIYNIIGNINIYYTFFAPNEHFPAGVALSFIGVYTYMKSLLYNSHKY